MDNPIRFILNDEPVRSRLPQGTVVLDFLRRERRLTGTKEGCREGDCGACTVLLGRLSEESEAALEYAAVTSCLLPLGDLEAKHLVSIEGLNPPLDKDMAAEPVPLTPVQSVLVEHGAIQCGFCTPGFVLSLTGYLLAHRSWSYAGALEAVAGNICRCTGYASIQRAIADLLERLGGEGLPGAGRSRREHLEMLVARRVVPGYFLSIPERLRSLQGEDEPRLAQQPKQRGRGRMKQQTQQHEAEHTVVAGGTDLFVQKPDQLLSEPLRFLSASEQQKRVSVEGDRLYLGAGITMEEVKHIPELSDHVPGLAEVLPLIASTPIRNRATVGGNIINASPIGDFTVMLLALGAVLGLEADDRIREVPLERFFLGYKQLDMKEGEGLEWVALPLERGSFSFEKVSRRRYLDIASVNSAAWMLIRDGRIERARLAAGGVAPVPLYLDGGSSLLEGETPRDELIEQLLNTVQEEIAPIGDVRGSERYKRLLLRQLLLAHFYRLFPEQMHTEVWV